ncbi:MAG TPA: HEAT repeat domain-containing protein [Caulobacteraceae bacterium]|nr:HEAT repeat domain-containing protein [Caulobacteraceae bacterium]
MKTLSRNRYQKAAFRPGEARVSRSYVEDLLTLARGDETEERLHAAKFLCPCHVRGRTEAIWQAVLALMGDADSRVRFAAWHTLEDGGVPREDGVLERLEAVLAGEADPKVRGIATLTIGPLIAERDRGELSRMRRVNMGVRGKCDFCGERNVLVREDLETRIPTAGLPRAALICQRCAA